MKKIKNKALLEVELFGKRHIIESNETVVEEIKILFEKFASCKYVFKDEPIKYDIVIKNESNIKLTDFVFKDTLDDDTKYINGTFKINGHHYNPRIHGKTLEFPICELKDNEQLLISFETKLDENNHKCEHKCD